MSLSFCCHFVVVNFVVVVVAVVFIVACLLVFVVESRDDEGIWTSVQMCLIFPSTDIVGEQQARKLGRCDSYLRNLKTLLTDSLTHPIRRVGARRCYRI